MSDMLRGYVWVIGGLAIIIGGVGMMNAQLMSVMERTREIGVLRGCRLEKIPCIKDDPWRIHCS